MTSVIACAASRACGISSFSRAMKARNSFAAWVTELAAMAAPDPVRFHPSMATAYRDKVGALIRGLGDAAQMELARESLRGLIEAIILTPDPNGAGLLVDLEGALAGLLHLALGTSGERGMAAKGGESPNGFFRSH